MVLLLLGCGARRVAVLARLAIFALLALVAGLVRRALVATLIGCALVATLVRLRGLIGGSGGRCLLDCGCCRQRSYSA
jgi:hypothetical protein